MSVPWFLAVQALRVGDFNGKTLSTIGSSTLIVDLESPEAQQLKFWCGSHFIVHVCARLRVCVHGWACFDAVDGGSCRQVFACCS